MSKGQGNKPPKRKEGISLMDNRKNYYIVLDTETCNGIVEDGKLNLDYSLVYDIGWAVVDKKGNVYEQRSFVVHEIFFEEQELMRSAYYADKLPQYYRDIAEGSRKDWSLWRIRQQLIEDMAKYRVTAVMAHNARFDVNALNNTERWLTKSQYRYFFPYGTEIWDTLKMSADTICKQKTYIRYCLENDYMTKHKTPRPRQTAEILYRYIKGMPDFIESHTGLEDVMIEKEIFAKCMAQHKKMRKRLWDK